MAKPIEIGLVLEGEDAKTFQHYLEHPTFTREGLNLMREAKRDAEHAGSTKKQSPHNDRPHPF
ncbi:MAG: hypothetical protein Q7T80_04620 [Methanoregula sp.]|nr:hypothetical protein [Methanoregula sp.]